jgi:LacI family transcriptional regulator
MSITIRQVAQKLGLSIATVSRALDGYPDIALETRRRVQQAAQEMGYTPNRAARQLRRRKADAIGYILPASTPRFADPFYAEFLVGLGDETALHPFDLLVSIAPPGEQAERSIYENWVQSRKVDGFVLNRIRHNDWRVRFLSEQGVPFVTLEHGTEKLDYPHIEVDNTNSMAALVRYLAQRGFERMAFIGGPADLVIHTRRLDGFKMGLNQIGLVYYEDWVMAGDLSSNEGYQVVKRMRWLPDPPNAIVCINDETAFGALHAIHEKGVKVGSEFAITGFDGVQASQHTDPPLTTLDISIYAIARRLVRLLVAEIQGQPLAERHIVIQPNLLARGSTLGRQFT